MTRPVSTNDAEACTIIVHTFIYCPMCLANIDTSVSCVHYVLDKFILVELFSILKREEWIIRCRIPVSYTHL